MFGQKGFPLFYKGQFHIVHLLEILDAKKVTCHLT
jgi:hypothetical protein